MQISSRCHESTMGGQHLSRIGSHDVTPTGWDRFSWIFWVCPFRVALLTNMKRDAVLSSISTIYAPNAPIFRPKRSVQSIFCDGEEHASPHDGSGVYTTKHDAGRSHRAGHPRRTPCKRECFYSKGFEGDAQGRLHDPPLVNILQSASEDRDATIPVWCCQPCLCAYVLMLCNYTKFICLSLIFVFFITLCMFLNHFESCLLAHVIGSKAKAATSLLS